MTPHVIGLAAFDFLAVTGGLVAMGRQPVGSALVGLLTAAAVVLWGLILTQWEARI